MSRDQRPGCDSSAQRVVRRKLDHQPVVAIVGQTPRPAIGGDYQQEVDLQSLFKDVAHEYVHTAMSPAQIRHLVDRAFRNALATRSAGALLGSRSAILISTI
jgi:pyruvate dehydrogenase (quinone)